MERSRQQGGFRAQKTPEALVCGRGKSLTGSFTTETYWQARKAGLPGPPKLCRVSKSQRPQQLRGQVWMEKLHYHGKETCGECCRVQCQREEPYGWPSTYLTLILGVAVATGIYEIWKRLRPPVTSAVFAYVSWKVNFRCLVLEK